MSPKRPQTRSASWPSPTMSFRVRGARRAAAVGWRGIWPPRHGHVTPSSRAGSVTLSGVGAVPIACP